MMLLIGYAAALQFFGRCLSETPPSAAAVQAHVIEPPASVGVRTIVPVVAAVEAIVTVIAPVILATDTLAT